jgi:hypothetical protein
MKPVRDPVLQHSRREAIVALALWLVALIYTVGFCAIYGYGGTDAPLTFVLGVPSWVMWGILAPWTVMIVASAWFAFAFMTDDSLE